MARVEDVVTISSVEITEQVGIHFQRAAPSAVAVTIFQEFSFVAAEYFLPGNSPALSNPATLCKDQHG